jgi:putative ATPase
MKDPSRRQERGLFDSQGEEIGRLSAPLADRMRPTSLSEFVGQDHLLGKGKPLRNAIEGDQFSSMIFWGPPGSGKTTLARIIASATNSWFIAFSAVLSGVKEIKEVIKEAGVQRTFHHRRTMLFVDEIHRFNKAQQDAFLPHVESGLLVLIGATTENPSFEVISPLLSRTRVFTLHPLKKDQLLVILNRALKDEERGLGKFAVEMEPNILEHTAAMADGDARIALNVLEMAVITTPPDRKQVRRLTPKTLEAVIQKKALLYDKDGEEHYNLISALHKSLRGSDPDAALYWLGRMLEAGEDPLYIARRMVRFASEDIGNADPQALQVAVAAMQAFNFVGLPEGNLALAQAAVYLAMAPKSNALYTAYRTVQKDIQKTLSLRVPLRLRNAPTKLMRELGYGKGYKYPHDFPGHYVEENYLPEDLKGRIYYRPSNQGYEGEIRKKLNKWRRGKG